MVNAITKQEHEKEVLLFKDFFEKGQIKQLYKKYGLTLLYSLENSDMVAYEKELGIKPQTAVDYYNHGVYYSVNKNNSSQAIKFFQKAIELDKNFSPAYYNLALAYQAGKEDKLAKKEFLEFVKLEEEKLKKSGEVMIKDGEVNYLEEAKKMLKGLK